MQDRFQRINSKIARSLKYAHINANPNARWVKFYAGAEIYRSMAAATATATKLMPFLPAAPVEIGG